MLLLRKKKSQWEKKIIIFGMQLSLIASNSSMVVENVEQANEVDIY